MSTPEWVVEPLPDADYIAAITAAADAAATKAAAKTTALAQIEAAASSDIPEVRDLAQALVTVTDLLTP